MSNKANQESICTNGTLNILQSLQGAENRAGTQTLVDTSAEQKGRDLYIQAEGCHDRPAWGTAPIRCGRTRCKWRGFEGDLKQVLGGVRCMDRVCPTCGNDDYMFMTAGEIKAWERAKAAALAAQGGSK